jgi:hypothetical protein
LFLLITLRDIDNFDKYQYWRDEKLANAVNSIEQCLLEIANPSVLSTQVVMD